MPNPDDILKAMRSAGEEFARMADTVEEKLPSIAKALSRAPRQLKPLIRSLDEIAKKAAGIKLDRLVADLAEADKGAGRFLQTLSKVDRHLRDSARVVAAMASSHRDLTIESQKSIRAVSAVAEKVNSTISKSLARRTSEFKDLSREADKATKNFQTPADAGGGGSMRGRPGAHLADNDDHADRLKAAFRASRRLRKDLVGMEGELSPIKEHFYGIEEGLKGLSGLIIKSRADLSKLSPEGMLEWGRSAVDQIDQLIAASEKFPGLEPISTSQLRNIRAAAVGMEDMTENADGMRDVLEVVGRQLEEVKSSGRGLNKALLRDIQRLADETGDWYGVSKKNQAELVTWRVKHQKAAERMVERGIRPSWAYAVQLGKAVKSVPIKALADEASELHGALKGALGQIAGIKSLTLTGLAKGFLETEESIIKARQELMEMTSQAGELSAMWAAGMDADAIVGEFDKLRDSMNNMLGTWGVTRDQAMAGTKALLDAGFAMSSILGPTLKESTDGLLGYAKAGEYAMSGLDELGKLTRLTGRSMADIAALAGQWREQLGTSIGEVGDTYLELQGHARRSGMAVGKFMDRLMASASGFVIFGTQIKDVSKTLSTLMSGMKLPPGLAQQVAGDFMDRLRETTMDEALMTVGLLGDEGRDAALQAYKGWVDTRGAMLKSVKREIESLNAKRAAGRIEEDVYSEQVGKAENRRKELEREHARLSSLVAKATAGDRASLAALQQATARQAGMPAVYARLTATARAMGGIVKDRVEEAVAAGKEPAEVMKAMASGFDEMTMSGKGLLLAQQRLKDLTGMNDAQFRKLLDGTIGQYESLKKYGELVGKAGDHLVQLVKGGGTLEEITAAVQESADTPIELLSRMRKLQAAGYAIPDDIQKKLEEAKEKFIEFKDVDVGKQVEAMRSASEASAQFLANVIAKPSPKDKSLKDLGQEQTSLQSKISETLLSIRNRYWRPTLAILGSIVLLMRARQVGSILGDMIPGRGLRRGAGKLLGRLSKAGRATSKAKTAIRAARAAKRGGNAVKAAKLAEKARGAARAARAARAAKAAGKVGTLAKVGTGASKALGVAGKIASKAAVPLVVAAEVIGAGMEVKGIRDAAAVSAKERSKALGDSEKEIAEKEARARERATTKGVVGKAVGQVGGAVGGALSMAAAGAALGTFLLPGIGTAIGGLIGGIAGALGGGFAGASAGEIIGNALDSEADKFGRKLSELYDLGSLADAKSAIAEERQRRANLQAEKRELIDKEIAGERLTHDERIRLQEIQRQLADESRLKDLENLESIKASREMQKSIEERMSAGSKFRLEAIRKRRDLERKKKERGLTGEEEDWLEKSKVASKMSDEDIVKYQAKEKKKKEMVRLVREKRALSGLTVKTDEDREKLKEIDATFAGAAVVGPKPPGAADAQAIERLKAQRGADVTSKVINDNSQWQVYIGTRSEKEMEQAMLKLMNKREQKLAN